MFFLLSFFHYWWRMIFVRGSSIALPPPPYIAPGKARPSVSWRALIGWHAPLLAIQGRSGKASPFKEVLADQTKPSNKYWGKFDQNLAYGIIIRNLWRKLEWWWTKHFIKIDNWSVYLGDATKWCRFPFFQAFFHFLFEKRKENNTFSKGLNKWPWFEVITKPSDLPC